MTRITKYSGKNTWKETEMSKKGTWFWEREWWIHIAMQELVNRNEGRVRITLSTSKINAIIAEKSAHFWQRWWLAFRNPWLSTEDWPSEIRLQK